MRSHWLAVMALLALSTISFAAEQPPAEESEIQIAFTTRIVTIPADSPLKDCPVREGEVAFLNDAQLKTMMETTQGLRRAKILQAPKITTPDGQEAVVNVVEEQFFVTSIEAVKVNGSNVFVPKRSKAELGMKLTLDGRVAADKQTVHVDVKYLDKRVDGPVDLVPVTTQITPIFEGGSQGPPMPFTQYLQVPQFKTSVIEKQNLKIPVGESAVIAGPVYHEEFRDVARIPLFSELPFLERLFTRETVSKVRVRTLLIVSARVLELKD
ncbi:MAG TPA: hypothetical protein VGL71_01250 [Urbifossiella sp.]|jgi:type II secretory pathway component GspD/PulD (secretin)